MEKIEYGDINRFLVSTGLVLVTVSLALPYFYLSEDFGLYLEEEKIKLFSLQIQNLILKKQQFVELIQDLIPYTSIGLSISGLFLLTIGLVRWFKRQSNIDKKENLELFKLELEINKLTPEEKRGKAEIEMEIEETSEIQSHTHTLSSSTKEEAVNNYLRIEERLVKHFKENKGESFGILDNVKVAGRFWVDIILEAKTREFSDKIIEVKYANKEISNTIITDALTNLDQTSKLYHFFYDRKVVSVLILVFSNKLALPEDQLKGLAQRVNDNAGKYKFLKRFQFYPIDESDIEKLDVKQILRR
jgi:hypothetical protein